MRNSFIEWAEILQAIAEGKELEYRSLASLPWGNIAHSGVLDRITDSAYSTDMFRVKPDVVYIGGFEVPGPIRGPIVKGHQVFLTNLSATQGLAMRIEYDPRNSAHAAWHKRGLLHFVHDNACTHAKALLSFTDTHEEVNE